MGMFERQLLQGFLLRLGQFNGTFHRQADHQNHVACQTPYFEIRLLVALNGLEIVQGSAGASLALVLRI
jgi:hypothetical protein